MLRQSILRERSLGRTSHKLGETLAAFGGVLMLDTQFPRPVGDIGNSDTFDFPVRYRKVSGASVGRVVDERDESLIEPFVDAALQLQSAGAAFISTSCGFLIDFQEVIAAQLRIPFISSALLALPTSKQVSAVGVLTFDSNAFARLLRIQQWLQRHPEKILSIVGLPLDGELATTIRSNSTSLDLGKSRNEVLDCLRRLLKMNSYNNASSRETSIPIILECTNLAVYQQGMQTLLDQLAVAGQVESGKPQGYELISINDLMRNAWKTR